MTPDEERALVQRVADLENKLVRFLGGDRYVMNRPLEMTNEATIGINNRSKVGFYGKTPVTQFNSTGEATGHAGHGGSAVTHTDDWYGGATFSAGNRYTINDIVKALKTIGILAP